jgi:hypothetical protein
MGRQTAVRRGNYKLVINGVLAEHGTTEDVLFLSDLSRDLGEQQNLVTELPELARELHSAAENWRADMEKHWTAKKERPL